tara:strand:+ start:1267 stop:1761 length:495 start_codon:yes stop_codon:yes gene_type:complete
MTKIVEKTDDGKIKYYTMEGKLIYPSINTPNFKFQADGLWETFLIPDNPEDLEMAKKIGVRTKAFEDKDIPEGIYMKRFTKNKNGRDNKPLIVKDADGNPFNFTAEGGREIVVGNNTQAKVMFHYWHHENKYGNFEYYILDGVRIMELVERQQETTLLDDEVDF